MPVTVIDHPLVKHHLSIIRDKSTPNDRFRQSLHQISRILTYEATRDVLARETTVETPLEPTTGHEIDEARLVTVAIFRAGLGMVPAFVEMYPGCRVGHLGMFRDEEKLKPVQYYVKLPPDLEDCRVFIMDPMLATGGSLCLACSILKERGAKNVAAVSLISAPEGIGAMKAAHPDVSVYTAAMDSHLNAKGYIVPGLGDAGDRQFGTYGRIS